MMEKLICRTVASWQLPTGVIIFIRDVVESDLFSELLNSSLTEQDKVAITNIIIEQIKRGETALSWDCYRLIKNWSLIDLVKNSLLAAEAASPESINLAEFLEQQGETLPCQSFHPLVN